MNQLAPLLDLELRPLLLGQEEMPEKVLVLLQKNQRNQLLKRNKLIN